MFSKQGQGKINKLDLWLMVSKGTIAGQLDSHKKIKILFMAKDVPFFSTHVIEEGHEMNNIDSIMNIVHKENNHKKQQTGRDRDSKSNRITEHTQ